MSEMMLSFLIAMAILVAMLVFVPMLEVCGPKCQRVLGRKERVEAEETVMQEAA